MDYTRIVAAVVAISSIILVRMRHQRRKLQKRK